MFQISNRTFGWLCSKLVTAPLGGCVPNTTGSETPVVEAKKSNPFNLNKWAISCFSISGGLFAQVLGVTYFIENLLWLVHVMAKTCLRIGEEMVLVGIDKIINR